MHCRLTTVIWPKAHHFFSFAMTTLPIWNAKKNKNKNKENKNKKWTEWKGIGTGFSPMYIVPWRTQKGARQKDSLCPDFPLQRRLERMLTILFQKGVSVSEILTQPVRILSCFVNYHRT